MIARIAPAFSRNGQLAGLIFRTTRPGWGAASPQRPIPAVPICKVIARQRHDCQDRAGLFEERAIGWIDLQDDTPRMGSGISTATHSCGSDLQGNCTAKT